METDYKDKVKDGELMKKRKTVVLIFLITIALMSIFITLKWRNEIYSDWRIAVTDRLTRYLKHHGIRTHWVTIDDSGNFN